MGGATYYTERERYTMSAEDKVVSLRYRNPFTPFEKQENTLDWNVVCIEKAAQKGEIRKDNKTKIRKETAAS